MTFCKFDSSKKYMYSLLTKFEFPKNKCRFIETDFEHPEYKRGLINTENVRFSSHPL